jgi:hypothetical protein
MSQMFSREDYDALPDRTTVRTMHRHRAFYRDPGHPELVFQYLADPMDLREFTWTTFEWAKPVVRFDVAQLQFVGGPLYELLSDTSDEAAP